MLRIRAYAEGTVYINRNISLLSGRIREWDQNHIDVRIIISQCGKPPGTAQHHSGFLICHGRISDIAVNTEGVISAVSIQFIHDIGYGIQSYGILCLDLPFGNFLKFGVAVIVDDSDQTLKPLCDIAKLFIDDTMG